MSLTTRTPTQQQIERTRARWKAHHWLSSRSARAGAKVCMHANVNPSNVAGTVTVSRTAGGAVHVKGVQRCGSVWACPACAPVVREHRAAEVDAGIANALAAGMFVYFVTATVQHKLRDDLSDVYKLVRGAWSKTMSGRAAADWRTATGFVGAIRVVEVTYSDRNGWHPHVHAALVFEREQPAGVLDSLGHRFAENVGKLGGYCDARTATVPLRHGAGWDWSSVVESGNVAGYLAKVDGGWGVGLELGRGDLKRGGQSLVPAELLELAVEGHGRAAVLFRQFEEVTAGTAFMFWSRGLRERLGLTEPELTDEEAAAVAPADVVVWSVEYRPDEWNAGVRAGRLGELLAIVRGVAEPPPLAA